MTDHAQRVIAAIIPNRRDLLDRALHHLGPAHFEETSLRNIFQMLERYQDITQSIMTRDALSDMLKAYDEGTRVLYLETYDALHDLVVPDADFIWSLQELREDAAERATGKALAGSMEILRSGAEDEKGHQLKGHVDARTHVLEKFAEIDRDLQMQEAPEGDMRIESIEMLSDYAERKLAIETGRGHGIRFGIPSLDLKLGGLYNGELGLTLGYSSDGKSSLCVQLAWSAAVEQGKNVVFLTTETLRPQIRRKVLCRHSRQSYFDLPEGLNSKDLRLGTLSAVEESKLMDIVNDFTKNPSYGKLMIAQVPRSATIAQCESRLYRYQRQFNVDLVIMDYLQLLVSSRRRQSDREEQSSIIKESKQLATTFDDGRGVPFVSPWQVNRTAREQAEQTGFYTLKATSETAEATNTPDWIISLLAPMDNDSRYCTIKSQILKNRDGATANSIELDVDYATSAFSSKSTAAGMDDLLAPSNGSMSGLLS